MLYTLITVPAIIRSVIEGGISWRRYRTPADNLTVTQLTMPDVAALAQIRMRRLYFYTPHTFAILEHRRQQHWFVYPVRDRCALWPVGGNPVSAIHSQLSIIKVFTATKMLHRCQHTLYRSLLAALQPQQQCLQLEVLARLQSVRSKTRKCQRLGVDHDSLHNLRKH